MQLGEAGKRRMHIFPQILDKRRACRDLQSRTLSAAGVLRSMARYTVPKPPLPILQASWKEAVAAFTSSALYSINGRRAIAAPGGAAGAAVPLASVHAGTSRDCCYGVEKFEHGAALRECNCSMHFM